MSRPLELAQPLKGYRYNSDSMFLYDFAARFSPRGRLLDVGCGSGVVGLLLARDFPVTLTAIDKQAAFVEIAAHNACYNGIEATVLHGDVLDLRAEPFDLIVSNPPFYDYTTMQSGDEMIRTARYNEHLPIVPFVSKSSKLLTHKGELIFCYDASLLPSVIAALEASPLRLTDLGLVYPKEGKNASLVLLRARKSSRAKLHIHPPLIANDDNGYTLQAQAIYGRAATKALPWKF